MSVKYSCNNRRFYVEKKRIEWALALYVIFIETCSGDLVHSNCHSACESICGEKEPEACIQVCVEGCGCPNGLYRSSKNSTTCVKKENCQNNGNNHIIVFHSNSEFKLDLTP